VDPEAAPSSSARDFIEYVARMLARSPDDVSVTETVDGDTIRYRLSLNSEDVGRVIGREGRIVRAIRSLLRAIAMRQGIRIALDID
jgi:predicted RNA-binding protein YlqC (UPF0109 family)